MISAAELTTLASSHDIISLGMLADDVRRGLHQVRTTFVRVADVAADAAAPMAWPPATGEIRIVGAPDGRVAAEAEVNTAIAGRAVAGIRVDAPDELWQTVPIQRNACSQRIAVHVAVASEPHLQPAGGACAVQ